MNMNDMTKKLYPVTGMHCAACAGNVEKIVRKQEGVENASVNLATATLAVTYNPDIVSPQQLKEAVMKIGFDLIIDEDNSVQEQEEAEQSYYGLLKRKTIVAWIFALPVAVLGMFLMNVPGVNWWMLLLSLPVILYSGRSFYMNAWKQTLQRTSNMDTLVALSTSIAFLFSLFNTFYPEFWYSRGLEPHVYYEAATVIIAFVLVGKLMEEKAKGKTSTAIRKLMGLQPRAARVVKDGREEDILIADPPGTTVTEIRAKARRMLHNKEKAVIILDYLQLVNPPAGKNYNGNRAVEVSEMSRGLKIMAKELGVPVIMLSQLNRSLEGRTGKRPQMSDLRESGSIEQDADIIMLLDRSSTESEAERDDRPDFGITRVILAKNRSGPVGDVDLMFLPASTKFYEIDEHAVE